MKNNIVTADFATGKWVLSRHLFQYDYGIRLVIHGIELPGVFVCDFCNLGDKCAETVTGEDQAVMIPDKLLQSGADIICYVVSTGSHERKTIGEIRIPVIRRAKLPRGVNENTVL